MFSSSYDFAKNTSIRNENPNASSGSESSSLEELKSRVAVRYLMRKTKRFDLLKQQMQHKLQSIAEKKVEPSAECLIYLGLAPKNVKIHERQTRKLENRSDFQFLKPRVYECNYCTKIFFHKLLYRRHMIRHLKKIHWCMKCNRGFTTKISKKRHELTCRR
ncbi:hypothetical protein ANTRET_LOCUS7777 [Anthophora retusa]